MSEEVPTHPFAMLTVSDSADHPSVSVSFHSGPGKEGPRVECFTYESEGRAPILALDQGRVRAQVTVADSSRVTSSDVRAARSVAVAALRYFESVNRMYRQQPSEPPERGGARVLPSR